MGCTKVDRFEAKLDVDKVIRRYENKIYFADVIKEFRRQMNVYENVVITFSAPNKNTTFHVFFKTPRYRQSSATSAATTRWHVFTVDVNKDMMQHKNPLVLPPEAFKYIISKKKIKRYMNVQRNPSRRCLWKINMQNGVPFVADSWYHYLADNDLMYGDDVVFYYTFNKHG
ncbi:hypothetical protein GmHk_04G010023 [Glycine max]|nr:hypothetical protein GmHk_04G010023 [Glycine max]